MGMLIVVAGLGLEGGSMAKALKKYTDNTVYGWNRTASVAQRALADGAIDGIADDSVLAQCDLLIPVLYPEATIDYLQSTAPPAPNPPPLKAYSQQTPQSTANRISLSSLHQHRPAQRDSGRSYS